MAERPLSPLPGALKRPASPAAAGDAALRRELEEKRGLAARGAAHVIIDMSIGHGGLCNILEFEAQKQARVAMSTWGAELCLLSRD